MLPELNLFGWSISTYWLMFIIGIVGMAILCLRRAQRYRLTPAKAILFALLLAICGLLGTKVLFILENWEYTLENGITLGGTSFYGALFLIPLLTSVYGRLLGMRPAESIDFCAPAVMLMLMFMRLGCWMNGCCGGIVIAGFQVPTQIIEAMGDAVICLILLYFEEMDRKKSVLYPLMMISYGTLRFAVEFFRDTPKDLLFLSRGHWYSLLAALAGGIWICVAHQRRTKNGNN